MVNYADMWLIHSHVAGLLDSARLELRQLKARSTLLGACMSYPIFTPKPSTHRMHDPGSIVPHIRPKGFTYNQLPRIKYDYYYINSVTKDYDDSWWNKIAEDSITPQE
jgi:hypothetical protein